MISVSLLPPTFSCFGLGRGSTVDPSLGVWGGGCFWQSFGNWAQIHCPETALKKEGNGLNSQGLIWFGEIISAA